MPAPYIYEGTMKNAFITGATVGQRLGEASVRLAEAIDGFAPRYRPIVTSIVSSLSHTLTSERATERIAVGGTANLARFGHDFDQAIQPVLEALEEQVVLLKLLGEATNIIFEGVVGQQMGAMGLADVPKEQVVEMLQAQGQANLALIMLAFTTAASVPVVKDPPVDMNNHGAGSSSVAAPTETIWPPESRVTASTTTAGTPRWISTTC